LGRPAKPSSISRILKAHGIPPVPERPTSWQTFLRAHWGAIAGADFFTTEVWTWRGLVTYYTVFVIDLASRRVHIVGSTAHPHGVFMHQVARTLTTADDGVLRHHRVLICDRDTKWSASVRDRLGEAGICVVQTPYQAPNANAYAERFVRSIKEECLDRMIPIGERHFRRARNVPLLGRTQIRAPRACAGQTPSALLYIKVCAACDRRCCVRRSCQIGLAAPGRAATEAGV